MSILKKKVETFLQLLKGKFLRLKEIRSLNISEARLNHLTKFLSRRIQKVFYG